MSGQILISLSCRCPRCGELFTVVGEKPAPPYPTPSASVGNAPTVAGPEATGKGESPPATKGHPKSHPFPKAERFGAKGRTLAQLTGGIPACIKVTRHGIGFTVKCSKDGWVWPPDGTSAYDDVWESLRVHRDLHHPLGGKKGGA